MSVLTHLKPTVMWTLFEELCKHPRPSKKEDKAVQWVLDLAKQHGWEVLRDDAGNVVLKKGATPGMEDRKTVVLQGHIDMVCEKNEGVEHDFDNDPIQPYVDGNLVKAKGTTLGADNGIGVVAGLAVLTDPAVQHGPIEILITMDEETGLTGASNLSDKLLDGKILLNLDSEEDGAVYIGCSGGKNTRASFAFTPVAPAAGSAALSISVTGLMGGHSGLNIHEGRANAIKLLVRLLWDLDMKFGISLASIKGGSAHNAIPRESFATIAVDTNKLAGVKEYIASFNTIVKDENSVLEKNLTIACADAALPATVIENAVKINILHALYALPHGVYKMSLDIPGLVETSTNLATITTEDGKVSIITSQRSSVASEILDIANKVKAVLLLAGAEVVQGDGYPGWKPNPASEVLGLFKDTFKSLYGKEPEVKAIHAGLECGILGERYPGMDMISFGPTLHGVHSPDERIEIDTVEKFWDILVTMLKNVPKK